MATCDAMKMTIGVKSKKRDLKRKLDYLDSTCADSISHAKTNIKMLHWFDNTMFIAA